MANNQMPLLNGEEEIITQAEAYEMAGITRAMLRGCLDRGELRTADHKGARGSARLFRADVVRLMAEKGWPGASAGGVLPQQTSAGACSRCSVLEAEARRSAETIRRLRDALAAATA